MRCLWLEYSGRRLAVGLVRGELPQEELPEVATEVSGLVEVENQVVVVLSKQAGTELSKRKRRTVVDESIDAIAGERRTGLARQENRETVLRVKEDVCR